MLDLLVLSLMLSSAPTQDTRPNIVLLFADDLGLGDLSVYNAESRIPTPHMDAIAHAGLRCTDAHSASAVCTPSRFALLTGQYAWRTHLKKWVLGGGSQALIPLGTQTLPTVLNRAGYTTLGVGKWHLGVGDDDPVDWSKPYTHGPCALGFDHWQGIPASLDMAPYVWMVDDRLQTQPTARTKGSKHRRQGGGGFWRAGGIAPDVEIADILPRTIDVACDWIAEYSGDDAPFFLYVPFSAPHTPWLPSNAAQGVSTAGWYGDFVVDVDRGIGRIDAALHAAGIAEDTIVIVTSDNGAHWPVTDVERFGHHANGHRRGQKADIHEGGHRVPFIVRWPGHVPANVTSEVPFCLVDCMATIAAAVHVQLPAGASPDGCVIDLLDPSPAERPIVHHSGDGMFALRLGRWKLIEGLGSGGFTAPRRVKDDVGHVQLYDLVRDPMEAHNVARGNPAVVLRMLDELNRVRGDD